MFIPELAARNQGVGGEQAHAVNLGRGVTLSDLVTANDEVLVELWVVQNVHLANCARRCECVPAWLPPTPFRHSLPPSPALLSVSRLSLQRTVRSVIRKKNPERTTNSRARSPIQVNPASIASSNRAQSTRPPHPPPATLPFAPPPPQPAAPTPSPARQCPTQVPFRRTSSVLS